MKCPYRLITTYQKRRQEYIKTYAYKSELIPCNKMSAEKAITDFQECIGDECAVFRNGECCRVVDYTR